MSAAAYPGREAINRDRLPVIRVKPEVLGEYLAAQPGDNNDHPFECPRCRARQTFAELHKALGGSVEVHGPRVLALRALGAWLRARGAIGHSAGFSQFTSWSCSTVTATVTRTLCRWVFVIGMRRRAVSNLEVTAVILLICVAGAALAFLVHLGTLQRAAPWLHVTTAPRGVDVLVVVQPHDRPVVVRARYLLPLTEPADDELCCGWGEYDEATDEYYCPEGWYECVHSDMGNGWGYVQMHDTPSAWCSIPKPPTRWRLRAL